jgi:adenylate cyclase
MANIVRTQARTSVRSSKAAHISERIASEDEVLAVIARETVQSRPAPRRSIRILPDDVEVSVTEGASILDASLQAGIAHGRECGGMARCSTCRVAIVEGIDACLPRNEREKLIAERLHFPSEVRLACQTGITGDLVVRRLVLDEIDVELTSLVRTGLPTCPVGREAKLAILFLDIRGFTTFSENLLPYDVIHLLRRFFLQMARVVSTHGGIVNNYMGDGMLALFGVEDPEHATLRAVEAGLEMLAEAERMKPYERSVGGKSFDIGVGVHFGEAVMGALGSPEGPRVTVIGDAVNTASRIESANKIVGTRLLISEAAYREVRGEVRVGRSFELSLPGKTGLQALHEVLNG